MFFVMQITFYKSCLLIALALWTFMLLLPGFSSISDRLSTFAGFRSWILWKSETPDKSTKFRNL